MIQIFIFTKFSIIILIILSWPQKRLIKLFNIKFKYKSIINLLHLPYCKTKVYMFLNSYLIKQKTQEFSPLYLKHQHVIYILAKGCIIKNDLSLLPNVIQSYNTNLYLIINLY